MAHFAQLDKDNKVINVVVVANADTCNKEGFEVEEIGQQFLKNMYGEYTRWVQTSYNSKFRKNYAGLDYTYDEKLDAFIPPKPYESWVLDTDSYKYVAPVPEPKKEGKIYFWNEENKSWIEYDYISPETIVAEIPEG